MCGMMTRCSPTLSEEAVRLAQRRAVTLLFGAAAGAYVLIEVVSGLAAVTASHFLGPDAAGVGPALVFLTAGAITVAAGKVSDRIGRRPVLAAGSLAASLGAGGVGFSLVWASWELFILALIFIGIGVGVLRLVKAAAADIYPSGNRIRGIGIVQGGGLAGAWIGLSAAGIAHPSGVGADTVPWFMTAGLLLFLSVVLYAALRPDPIEVGYAIGCRGDVVQQNAEARSLYRMLQGSPRMTAVLFSASLLYGAMVMDMSLVSVMLTRLGLSAEEILVVMAIHFTGMLGPMWVTGQWATLCSRKGLATLGCALVMGATTAIGVRPMSVIVVAVALFVVGVGWCVGWVAGLGELAEYARANERGALMGAADLSSSLFAALLVLGGGAALATIHARGLALIGVMSMAIALLVAAKWWPERVGQQGII